MSLESFFNELPTRDMRDLWRSGLKGLKYASFFLLTGLLYHGVYKTLFGHVHPGVFDELFWEFWGVFWGVFFYHLNHE